MAYNVSSLIKVGDDVYKTASQNSEIGSNSKSGSSISLSSTKSSRNELSDALDKIRLSKETLSETKTSSEKSEDSKSIDSAVKAQQKILNLIQRETERAATNIVMHVKYYSSPLRIFLKTKFMLLSLEDKMKYAMVLKLSNFVKEDLVSEWNAKDFFGLKVLIKMYRLSKMVMPMLDSHKQFLEYFKGGDVGNEPHRDTIYYIYNYVMNPGFGYYSQENMVPLEHEVHQWLSTFLVDRAELLQEAGYDIVDFQKELVKKVAFDLNIMASTMFKKPISFKYFVSAQNIQKETLDAEETMKQLYNMYESSPVLSIIAQQMMYWMNNDDPMQGQPRAILGGCGWMGGKTKKSKKYVRKTRK